MASVAKTFKVKNGLDVVGGKSTAAASTTSYASLNLPPGTAPTSPANGDIWSTSAGLYVRINGTTVGPLGVSTWGQITGTLSNQTDLQNALNLKANLASPTFTGTVTTDALAANAFNSGTGTFTNTTDASSTTTGSLKTAGGMGIAKKLYVGTDLSVGGNVTSGTWQGSVVSPTYGGTGVNNGSRTITLGGNLTTSGAFATTFTVTGTTSVTLPTSGTLVNTAVATLDSLTSIDTTNTATHTLNVGTAATASAATKTINLGTGGAAGSTTNVNIGSSVAGTTTINSATLVGAATTQNVFNSTATTVNAFGAATTISLGAGTGTTTVNNNLTVTGNLTVNGTVSTINSTTITVDDKNIELGSTASPSDATADGGGITLKGSTDKTFNWVDATDSWTSSEHLDLASGKVLKINGTQVLSASQYTGNAATATTATTAAAWSTSRTITLGGDLSGSVSLDGSANVTLTATVAADSVALGTDTTGNYVATIAGTTNRVTVSGSGTEGRAVTLSLPQDIHISARPEFQAITLAQENNTAQLYFIGRGEFAPVRLDLSTNSTPTTLDSWDAGLYSTADYQVTFKHATSGKMTSTLLRVMWDGTDVHYAEYGALEATAGASDVVLTATYSSPNILVQATSATAATDNLSMTGFVTRVRQS